MEELEIVPHRQSDGVHIFINKVEYRSPHFHPEWELLWVLDTPLSITGPQQQYLIQPGELILFPPNYAHEFHKMERPCTFLCMQLSARAFPAAANLRTEDIRLAPYLSGDTDRWLRGAMLDASQSFWEQDSLSPLLCQGLCCLILHKLLTVLPFHSMTVEERNKPDILNGSRRARIAAGAGVTVSDVNQVLKGLKSAAGYLRRELGHALNLRHTPELTFVRDDSIDQGAHILDMLRNPEIVKPANPANAHIILDEE